MGTIKTDTKSNCVTLRGSAQLVSDFFFYGINSILYQRGIYAPESFTFKQQYGLTVYVTTDEGVKSYLDNVLSQIKNWLEEGQIHRLVLAISNVDTKEPVERWDFKIENQRTAQDEKAAENTEKKFEGKELKEIQNEMRAVIRQITASVTFLPLLECACSFDLLVYTRQDCVVPDKWNDDAPCYIANAESVKLRSFSTSIHKVDSCVSYKLN